MVICELLLLKLGDLLTSSLLRNYFTVERSNVLVNISAVLSSISGGSETNSKSA